MAYLRDQYWCQYYATTLCVIGKMAPSAFPVVLWMIASWEEWLTKHTIPRFHKGRSYLLVLKESHNDF